MFAADVDTASICTCDRLPKPQMRSDTTTDAPPRAMSNVRLSRLMRWQKLTQRMPASVEKKVAMSRGTKMSVGWAAPICAR